MRSRTWCCSSGILVLVYTFVPIFIVVLMSFNKLPSEQSKIYKFNSFTLDNWLHPCADPSMCDAAEAQRRDRPARDHRRHHPRHAAAFALVRHDFVGRSTHERADLPADGGARDRDGLLAAGAVRGRRASRGQLGFWTILIAHIMFCLSFVVVTVRARLAGLSDTLEQAAMDLYATPQQTFWRVTFPLVFPGILGAALLSFSLSFDDFIITNLNAGTTTTFPMYVWGVRATTHPDADQRRRHGDVPDLGADRGRRRGQRATSPAGVQGRDCPQTGVEAAAEAGPSRW